ncbi:MAG TPA: hypothetical protein VFH39_04700, partial [Candidatus Saccharimonadales bacterium]|nr:hypothetical protein [Candidatus Saccharimonadales bacterium]
TSSGCPVRHRLPLFRSDPSTSLEPLAELFNASPERLAAPREQSGIDIGLNALARLLDRALDIQELGRPSLADAGR